MIHKTITTQLGNISVVIEGNENGEPLVFMHGLFMDKTLWQTFDSKLTGRTHIYIDMPSHGLSSNVNKRWSLDDCTSMLIEILDALKITRCIIIGHSWGSMTGLRAAHQYPKRFSALGLFNMPFERTTGVSRVGFIFQKLMTLFPKFYAKQAAKALYSVSFLLKHPELSAKIQTNLSQRPSKEISQCIDAIILDAIDTKQLLNDLQVPALAVKGEADYVGIHPKIEMITVPGGHISPHEAPKEISQIIKQVVNLSSKNDIQA